MPRISVVVPVYNTEKYLSECIDSILCQTFCDFELILVNDGSKDQSGDICDEYAQKDGRVHVIHQKNAGVTAARNAGLAMATGEYVSFIDSDDWLDPDMYLNMLKKADETDADLLLCDMLVCQEESTFPLRAGCLDGYFDAAMLKQHVFPRMLFDFERNEPALRLNLCNKLIRTHILKTICQELPDDLSYGEDALYSLACLLYAKDIYIIKDSPYYYYRQTGDFTAREKNISLLPRLARFAEIAEQLFEAHQFDGMAQLSAYVAQVSLYCTRQILVYNKDFTMCDKQKKVREHFEKEQIHRLLLMAEDIVRDEKTRRKIEWVNQKRFWWLTFLFMGKEVMMKIKKIH